MANVTRGIGAALMLATGALMAPHAWAAAANPQEPIVIPRMTRELPEIPGKEVLMLVVEYPPGGKDPVHRHDAHGFIYVLEGEIVMGVKGGQALTLRPGDTFYEGPGDVHTIGRNASSTRRARFLVLLVKNRGTDPVLPAK